MLSQKNFRENYPEKVKEYQKKYNLTRKDKNGASYNKEYMKNWMRERRKKCLQKYGNKCKCCGENRNEFLAFDHIQGGGTKHRKLIGNITDWIIKNDYPNTVRILCHNCNQAFGSYGYCPHGSQ